MVQIIMASYLQLQGRNDQLEGPMNINIGNLKEALRGQIERNDIVANNLANINTTGYKKDVIFFDAFEKEMSKHEGQHQTVDFTQGELKETNNPLDLAISGKGFFTVDTDNGPAYTREGHFKLDGNGVLRTISGEQVMGEAGPIVILGEDLNPKSITITREGEIYADEEYIDRLAISDFENHDQLQKVGSNLYRANDEAELLDPENIEIHQGFLEDSNVNPADEMIQLIEIQRQFESMQKMVRSLDNVFRSAANDVAKY